MRSRLWTLILRELPYPLRWFVREVLHVLSWLDRSITRVAKGFRESPAWYFVTVVGTVAVLLTITMFISLVNETSKNRPKTLASRSTANLSRHDLELRHDWAVQDRWRVAHLFVPDQAAPKTENIKLDSRLFSSRITALGNVNRKQDSGHNSLAQRTNIERNLDVHLDLSRPKKAQQDHRMVTRPDIKPGSDSYRPHSGPRIQERDSRLFVQAAWDFGAGCDRPDYVSLPRRRQNSNPISVPEPEIPFVPVIRNHPDLAFEMAMERHFTVAGRFPPGSHLVRHSELSVFPENFRRFPSELVSHEENPWKWRSFHPSSHLLSSRVKPYEQVGTFNRLEHLDSPADEYNEALRAVADVALSIELRVPSSVSASETNQSTLVVSNEGPDPVSQVEVKEFLSESQIVIDATPDASSEAVLEPNTGSSEKVWHREFPELSPGTEQELVLKWIPEGSHRLIQRARVIARAEVSTLTEVSRPFEIQQLPSIPPERVEHHPALACDIQYLDRVHVGDDVELQITVRNTGDVTLHDVKFEIEFPTQFSHLDGQTVVFEAGRLSVKGRAETVLKFSAVEAGEAVNLIRLSSAERVHASGRNTIQVVERRQEKSSVTPTHEPVRTKAPDNWKLTNPTTSQTKSEAKSCCCQKLQISQLGSDVLFP